MEFWNLLSRLFKQLMSVRFSEKPFSENKIEGNWERQLILTFGLHMTTCTYAHIYTKLDIHSHTTHTDSHIHLLTHIRTCTYRAHIIHTPHTHVVHTQCTLQHMQTHITQHTHMHTYTYTHPQDVHSNRHTHIAHACKYTLHTHMHIHAAHRTH